MNYEVIRMESYRLIPEKYRFISNSGLKCIALVTMLTDHYASAFLQNDQTVFLSLFGHKLTVYTLLRIIGRLAFPIYAFLIVEGLRYTRNRKAYAIRLLVFAIISEIPWNLLHTGSFLYQRQNVFFTLLLGYLGLWVIDSIKNGEKRLKKIGILFALFLISVILRADYGCTGFGFILLLGLLDNHPVYRAVVGSCFLSSTWQAGLAFIPIAFYNGQRGFIRNKFLKLLFYVIYPLHMIILFLIKKSAGGY